jgi:hypothetical protein
LHDGERGSRRAIGRDDRRGGEPSIELPRLGEDFCTFLGGCVLTGSAF